MTDKYIFNIFISHCESISNGAIDSIPSIQYALLTLLDPYVDIVQTLSGITLPKSTEPYSLVIDHGIQNGFSDFRFTTYAVDTTGTIREPFHHSYSSIDMSYCQQADKILLSAWDTVPKAQIIKMFLEQKGKLLSDIQQHARFLCCHTDMCETCALHRTTTCPNATELPTANDWVYTLTHLANIQKLK